MSTCADCRWWAPTDGGEWWGETWLSSRGPAWGECALTASHDAKPAGTSSWEREPEGTAEARAETRALAKDVSGYAAVLVTAPDFGCVQWKAKP